MNRRNLLAVMLGIGAAPAAFAGVASRAIAGVAERIPLWSIVYRGENDPAAFARTRHEADELVRIAPEAFDMVPAEFVPAGRFVAFMVRTRQVPEFTRPTDVPTHFGETGYFGDCTSLTKGEPSTRADAIAVMLEHNRNAIGRDGQHWAVVAELGEQQGRTSDCLECGPHEFGMVSRTQYHPCRLIRVEE